MGSPVSLVDSLGSGVVAFVCEPAKGIVQSPQDFGKGIATGTEKLVKGAIFGVFNSASKLTGTVAKVGETLTFDDDYRRKREISKQKEARHVGEGLAYGVRDLGKGIFGGITGLVTEPIKGGKKDGAVGVLKGIGKGLTGVILKPTIGVVDVVTRTTEGIKNTTTYFDNAKKVRKRYPRYFDETRKIIDYDDEHSFGSYLLYTVSSGKHLGLSYIYHIETSPLEYILLSNIFIFRLKTSITDQITLRWKCKVNQLAVIETRGTTIWLNVVLGGKHKTKAKKSIKFQDEATLQEAEEKIFNRLNQIQVVDIDIPDIIVDGDEEDEANAIAESSEVKVNIPLRRSRGPEKIEGWLQKKGADRHANWKKRWFTLINGELSYRKKKEDLIMGSFFVGGNKIQITHIDHKKHAFKIDVGERIYYCQASSDEERQEWIDNCLRHGAIFE